ncbi:MAG: hypothetical protein HQ582_19175 [Planctomycetes bacterium]|nr:hypothetical protein [Planctomycetota bacterium]
MCRRDAESTNRGPHCQKGWRPAATATQLNQITLTSYGSEVRDLTSLEKLTQSEQLTLALGSEVHGLGLVSSGQHSD